MKKPTMMQKFHLSRLGLFLILAVAVLIARGSNPANAINLTYNKQAVLAYATNMSINDLLAAANQSRAANGLAPLTLNAKLNNSAQMKAQDMITNNYWAHISPTGVQPWYWFQKAGYNYSAAGENLAYGFYTGYEVNAAWMNSTSHRDNILGSYVDVGFGIASGPQYQGAENTVVVAHYGKPVAPAPAPAPTPAPTAPTTPAPPTPTPTTTVQRTAPAASPAPAPASTPASQAQTPAPTPASASAQPTPQTEKTQASTPQSTLPVNMSSVDQNVSVLDQLKNGKAGLAAIVSIVLVGVAGVGFILTHRALMHHLIQNGRKFILHHPLIDFSAVAFVVTLILTSSVGHLI